MRKRVAALVVLVVSAALLSGCVAIKSVTSSQLDIVGKLRLTVVVCKVDNPTINHPGCDLQSNNGEGSASTNQILVGFRIPTGTTVPQALAGTTNDPVPQSVTFTRSASYESELTKLLPPGAGKRWVGYVSGVYSYAAGADGSPAREVALTADLGLPRAADGGPFVGPLRVRPVTGGRLVNAELPATRPVDCGDSPFGAQPTTCVDSPVSTQIATDFNFATRDFGVVTGGATASPGQTVQLPFDVRGAGTLPAGLTAAITAATSLPGATATPSLGSVPLANGSNTRVTVPIAIPRTAGPGTYAVSVTGRIANGQSRTGTAQLTVRDRQKPVLSRLRLAPKRFKPGIRVPAIAATPGTRVSYSLSEAAGVRLSIERCAKRARNGKRCVRYSSVGAVSRASVKGANRFRFTGFLNGKRLKAGAYRLVATPTDGAGNRGAALRTGFTVRR